MDGSTPRIFVGTMEYAPPEQWGGQIVEASDLYALGGTLFYMIAGRHAFKKDRRDAIAYMNAHIREPVPDLLALKPGLPPELNRLFQRMMAKDHQDRGEATELLKEFQRLRPGETAAASTAVSTSGSLNPGQTKPSTLSGRGSARPTEAKQSQRDLVATSELRLQNPVSRMVDRVLSLLEGIFIPGHLQDAHGDELAFLERSLALLRRPLVLTILAVLVIIVILCR
jgi:serine/threonine protein kinase